MCVFLLRDYGGMMRMWTEVFPDLDSYFGTMVCFLSSLRCWNAELFLNLHKLLCQADPSKSVPLLTICRGVL